MGKEPYCTIYLNYFNSIANPSHLIARFPSFVAHLAVAKICDKILQCLTTIRQLGFHIPQTLLQIFGMKRM